MSEPAAAKSTADTKDLRLKIPRALHDKITAMGEQDMRDVRNMAVYLLDEAVKNREKASKPVKRAAPPPGWVAPRTVSGDPFTATDSGTSPV